MINMVRSTDALIFRVNTVAALTEQASPRLTLS